MNPIIATAAFIFGIVGLFWLNRGQHVRESSAIWIPTIWLLINASRPLSLWLDAIGLTHASGSADVYVEGSPVDAAILALLLIAGLLILAGRVTRLGSILSRNLAVVVYFSYCLLSVFWSEFSWVTLKHWTKGIGDVVMVLVVLTDPEVHAAVKSLFNRIGFVVIPLSVLFIKYIPYLGRWTSVGGEQSYSGVTTQKNTLGVICLIFGLGSLWQILALWPNRDDSSRNRRLLAHGIIFAMVVWLLWMCDSVTAIVSLAMASCLMLFADRPAIVRSRWAVHVLVLAMLCVPVFVLFSTSDSGGEILHSLGRNPTLTGRTAIWHASLSLAGNPVVGTGYESFWLGSRLERFWTIDDGAYLGIQEAHNGYLEVFLNIGWIGVALLAIVILNGYRNLVATLRSDRYLGALGLGFFIAELNYNFTEAGFRMMFPLWFFFLLSVMFIPKKAVVASHAARVRGRVARITPRMEQLVRS
jgi:exopolysaccharide production protein ExoQ